MSDKGSDFSRRRFLSTAATGLVSAGLAGLAPSRPFAQQDPTEPDQPGGQIIHRTLGRTGFKLPIVSMGVMNANNPEIVQASYEIGMRHFDTAAGYQFGRNEQMVGSVINRLGVRDKVIIGTKIMTAAQRAGLSEQETRDKIIADCDASLRRLKTDYIDIFYVHSVQDPAEVGNQGLIDGLQILKDNGKIRFTGITTHTRMAETINAAVEGGFYDVVLTSINFTMADDTALLGAIANAASKGIGVVAMKTQAGGARWPNPASRKDFTSTTIATAALKWVMRNENIHTSIPGFTNYEHMREDFSVALNLEYTPDEEKLLSDNSVKLGMGFCRQCRTCLASCPDGVEVPTLMRVHMYSAQYANFHHARTTLKEIPAGAGLHKCLDCSICQAQCANAVDIARRIDELKAMYC